MKKFFRKSLACIIAVMMIATSLPFSAITAGAATTKTDTISMNAFGAFKSGDASRVGADYISICNDGQNTNFVMAVFTFDVSALSVNPDDSVSAVFNYYTQFTQSENKGVSFYYPTQHLDEFNIANQYAGQPNSSIWTADDSNHLSRAISYYSLQELQLNIPISSTKTNGQLQIGPAIKHAKDVANSRAVVIGVIASAGQSGSGGGWTDTSIGYTSKNVDVTVTTTSEREYTFTEAQSALASFSAYYPSAHGSFSGDDSYTNFGDHYKGLLYAENVRDYSATGSIQLGSNWVGSNSCYANLYFPTAVALYSGSNEVTVPIMISASVARSGTWGCKFRGQSGVIVGSGLSLVNSIWNGKDEKTGGSDNCYTNGNQTTNLPSMNFMWTINQTTYKLSTDGTTSPTNSDIDPGYGKKAEIWANKVKVTPTFTDDTKVTYLDYYPEINFYVSSSGESFNSSKVINLKSTDYVRVVNYKPYLDKLATVKSDIAKMTEENYSPSSLSAYTKACSKFLNLNPTNYGYASDYVAATNSVIADMNSAMSAYDTAKANLEYNYVFKRIDGRVLGSIPAKSYAEALTATTAYFYDPSPATTKAPDGTGNHTWTTYAWPNTVADGVYEITEVATPHSEACTLVEDSSTAQSPSCTEAGKYADKKCSICGYVETGSPISALGHEYEYTYKDHLTHTKTCKKGDISAVEEAHTDDGTGQCSLCKGTLLDKTALNAAIATATPIIEGKNTDGTYVAESFDEFKAVYERVTTANPTTQDDVNSLTAELTTAINTLRKATLTVQFDKKVDTAVTEGTPESCTYGEVKEFTVTDGDVEKWEIITDNGTDQPATTTYIKTGENTISLVITRNVHVIAQIAKNGTTKPNITKVVFRGRNNAVVAIKYIEADEHLATAGVDIPTIPFYHADSWDKDEVIGLDNGGEITVRAQYTFNGQEADKCGIHFTHFDGGVKKFNYDSLVKLNNSSEYFGMYEDEAKTKLLTYFKTDEFCAPHNSDIYVFALDSAPTTATVGVTGSYSGTDVDAGKKYAVFNCKFFVPDGATVLEWGIKATAGGQTRTLKQEKCSRRNEYSFMVKFSQSSSISSIDAQAYIIYKLGDTKETVLSNNTVTQNF